MAESGVRAAAAALRRHTRQTADSTVRELEYAEVMDNNPLRCELHGRNIELDDEDIVFGQWLRRYDAKKGIKVGDTLTVKRMRNQTWIATDVISQESATGHQDFTAGDGLSFSGPDNDVLDVGEGFGINVHADEVAVDDTVMATIAYVDSVTGGGGAHAFLDVAQVFTEKQTFRGTGEVVRLDDPAGTGTQYLTIEDDTTGAASENGSYFGAGWAEIWPGSTGGAALGVGVWTDNLRLRIMADGTIQWSGVGLAWDTNLYRAAANVLRTDDEFQAATIYGIGATNAVALGAIMNGDSWPRFWIKTQGLHEWGGGSGAPDTNLYRDSADVLKTDDDLHTKKQITMTGETSTALIQFTSDTNLYRSAASVLKTDDAFVTGSSLTFGSGGVHYLDQYSSGSALLSRNLVLGWDNSGTATLYFGQAADTSLYRASADVLATSDTFFTSDGTKNVVLYPNGGGILQINSAGNGILRNFYVSGDTEYAFGILGDGKMWWGAGGSTAPDVNLYRNGANILKTDDYFVAAGQITGQLSGKTALVLTSTGADTGLTLGGDTNLYRSAADTLKTDDALQVTGALTALSGAAMNSQKITGLAAATTNGDAVRYEQLTGLSGTYQSLDATLTALAGLATGANKLAYSTGTDTFSQTDFSAGGRALVNAAGTADTFPYFSASNTVTLQALTAGGRALVNVTGATDTLPYYTSSSAATTTSLTSTARSLLDDTSVGAMRTTLDVPGLNTANTIDGLTTLSRAGNDAPPLRVVRGTDTAPTGDILQVRDAANTNNLLRVRSDGSLDVVNAAAAELSRDRLGANFEDTWQVLHAFAGRDMTLDSAAGVEYFVGQPGAGVTTYYDWKLIERVLIDPAAFATIAGKNLRFRLVGWAESNATDPNTDLTFTLYPMTFAGGTDTMVPTLGSAAGTATITNTNLNASDYEDAASSSITISSKAHYTVTCKNVSTLANNAAVWFNARIEYRWE